MTEQEEWVNNAMSDDTLVVNILLRLNQADPPSLPPPPPPPPTTTNTASSTPLQLEWSVRQRRSKQVGRKKGESTRASPTTPLSWSGATTSASGASTGVADGFEESSKPPGLVDNPRSKVIGTSETTTTKKSRKKKTLAELREEEDLLLKERRNLTQQLASLHVNIVKEKATNESLKKMKLDVVSHQTTETVRASPATEEAITNQPHKMEVDCDLSRVVVPANGSSNELNPSVSNASSKVQEDGSKTSSFALPDLNLPLEDDPVSRDLYRIS